MKRRNIGFGPPFLAPYGEIERVWPAIVGFGALFGFHDEAGAFVEIDEVGGAFAVAVVEPDGFIVD
jgi:hypothetical protein